MFRFSWVLISSLTVLTLVGSVGAQTDAAPDDALSGLREISSSMDSKRARIADLKSKPELSAEDTARIAELLGEIQGLEELFSSTASNGALDSITKEKERGFELQEEISDLFEPLIRQAKEITSEPRQIEQLRSRVRRLEESRQLLTVGLKNAQELSAKSEEGSEVRRRLGERINTLKLHLSDVSNQVQVTQLELNRRLGSRKPLVETTGAFVEEFFRTRGLNLLLATVGFFAVFVVLRFVRHRVLRIIFRRRASFYSRLLSVLLQLLGVVCALGAAILVLFALSDWILLLLVLIFLVGIGWASVNMLPKFVAQVRLLLNLGSVREGERVIFNGIPWRIEELKIYTLLRNPELTGGEFRIPVADLVDHYSRPIGENEIWFPCRQGDWVILDGGVRARVALQTPDLVQVVEPGGGRRTYSATDFLTLGVRNLSMGFRVTRTFGIDYAHQAISTRDVPVKMKAKIESGLQEIVATKEVLSVSVEFSEAGASSLDYAVLVDFDGSVAARYDVLKRTLARLLVDACNEEGWVIPFTQITLHQS